MMKTGISRSAGAVFRSLLAMLVLLTAASPSLALVLHNDADAPTGSDRPGENVVGYWGGNASCVAIGRSDWDYTSYVLTVRHQGGGVGTTVNFGGESYRVAEQWTTGSADIRISRIEKTAANGGGVANLSSFVQWYSGSSEAGDDIVIGGFGKTRGTAGSDGDGSYYTWAGTDNHTELWGTNRADSTQSNLTAGSYTSDVIFADFDEVASQDCSIAEYDSGGGWFTDVQPGAGTDWQLVGLSAYVGALDKSYYYPSASRGMAGIRVSSYATWIDGTVPTTPEPATLGILVLGGLAISLRRRRKA